MLGLKPIKTLPIREKIAANLREAILSKNSGREILTLESTAQELGVSITPTREAFQILARNGLLELERNKRAVVLGVNEKRSANIFRCGRHWKVKPVFCVVKIRSIFRGLIRSSRFPEKR